MARQELDARGDGDGESTLIQLMRLQSKTFPELTDWLSKKTEIYTSYDLQNEIVNLMSNQIVTNLLKSLGSYIFSVVCDEYTDVSNKEQSTFCMHWVNNDLEVSEKFLRFYEIPDIKSGTIVKIMKNILPRCQHHDICHDGATNMLRKTFGVATQIFEEQRKSHYTHCHAHSLLLSVKYVTKNNKILRDTISAEEIIIFIKYSPKRESILGSMNEQIECENNSDFHANNLSKLSETRSTMCTVYFKRILDNYNVLWNVWKHCLQNNQAELKSKLKWNLFIYFLVPILVTKFLPNSYRLKKASMQ